MKLQTLMVNKFKKCTLIKLSSNQLGFCSQKRWKLLSAMFLKECEHITKMASRYINNNLSEFSSFKVLFSFLGLESPISRNIRNFFRVGLLQEKIWKTFSRKNFEAGIVKYKKFFNLRARKFYFIKYKKMRF